MVLGNLGQAVQEANTFADTHDGSTQSTIVDALKRMKEAVTCALNRAAKAKVLLMELMLITQIKKFNSSAGTENAETVAADTAGFVRKLQIFLSDNLYGLTASRIEPTLWAAAQKHGS